MIIFFRIPFYCINSNVRWSRLRTNRRFFYEATQKWHTTQDNWSIMSNIKLYISVCSPFLTWKSTNRSAFNFLNWHQYTQKFRVKFLKKYNPHIHKASVQTFQFKQENIFFLIQQTPSVKGQNVWYSFPKEFTKTKFQEGINREQLEKATLMQI